MGQFGEDLIGESVRIEVARELYLTHVHHQTTIRREVDVQPFAGYHAVSRLALAPDTFYEHKLLTFFCHREHTFAAFTRLKTRLLRERLQVNAEKILLFHRKTIVLSKMKPWPCSNSSASHKLSR